MNFWSQHRQQRETTQQSVLTQWTLGAEVIVFIKQFSKLLVFLILLKSSNLSVLSKWLTDKNQEGEQERLITRWAKVKWPSQGDAGETPTPFRIIDTHPSMEILEIKFQKSVDFKSLPHPSLGDLVTGREYLLKASTRAEKGAQLAEMGMLSAWKERLSQLSPPPRRLISPNKRIEISLRKLVTWGSWATWWNNSGDHEACGYRVLRKKGTAVSGQMAL